MHKAAFTLEACDECSVQLSNSTSGINAMACILFTRDKQPSLLSVSICRLIVVEEEGDKNILTFGLCETAVRSLGQGQATVPHSRCIATLKCMNGSTATGHNRSLEV